MCAIRRQVFWLRRQTRPPPSQSIHSSDIFGGPLRQYRNGFARGSHPASLFRPEEMHLRTTYDSVVSMACHNYSLSAQSCQP